MVPKPIPETEDTVVSGRRAAKRATALVSKKSLSNLLILSLGFLAMLVPAANSSNSLSYDFNTAGQLTGEFNAYQAAGTNVTQSANNGIGGTGAIYAGNSANAIFASMATYSMGAQGSTYEFSSYMKSVFNSGYSGMGFTSLPPLAENTHNFITRPSDALGVSVHGGGFVFHVGATDYNGSWNQSSSGSIVAVRSAPINDLLNNGSADDWYLTKLKIERVANNRFTMRVEVWPANSNGSLINSNQADAVFEIRDVANETLRNAASISSYINFSGSRVEYFDNFQVNLTGATVIAAGTPVVLTTSVTESSGVISVDGNVTSAGGSSVTERGFVYGTSSGPTIADNKVALGTGTGIFSGSSTTLSSGTYYVRAFATNDTGTSYGTESQVTVTGPATYLVAYDANSATSGSVPSNQTKIAGSALTLATNSGNLARTGFSFAGWNTLADGTGTNYSEGASYTSDSALTLYAKWTVLATYSVTYNANGADSGSAPSNQTKTAGSALTLSSNSGNLTKAGFNFVGWNTAADGSGTGYSEGANYTVDSTVTLYASWAAIPPPPPYSGPIITEFSTRQFFAGKQAEITVSGLRLSSVKELWVDGKKLKFERDSDGRLSFSVPALAAGTYNLRVINSDGSVLTHQDAFQVVTSRPLPIRAFSVSSFAGGSARLSSVARTTLISVLGEGAPITRVACTGSTSGRQVTEFDRKLALSRARAACQLATQMLPGAKVEILAKPAAGVGARFRSVTVQFFSD